jgi:D-alanyl-D-alanine carboxypeptidase
MALACVCLPASAWKGIHVQTAFLSRTTRPRVVPDDRAARGDGCRACGRRFAATKAPGVVVGIWVPGEGSFRIGSITKTFTATLLQILADEKKLGLDDPVSKYVAWVPNGDKIKLRMLADMTAGLHSYTEDDAWVKTAFSDFKRVWTPRELVDVGIKSPPDFPPPHGTTVQTLDDKLDDATNRDPSWAFTAGQLVSTMADLRTWVVSYATGSLVSPEMQKQRLTWMTMPPNTPEHAYGIGIGIDHGWLGHTGELPGYNCGAYYLPAKKAVLVVMVNADIPAGEKNPAPTIMKALTQVLTPGNVPQ